MTLNKDQLKALHELKSGANVFLTGGAGTGKTFLLHYFLDLPENQKKNVIVCAPTGVAALMLVVLRCIVHLKYLLRPLNH